MTLLRAIFLRILLWLNLVLITLNAIAQNAQTNRDADLVGSCMSLSHLRGTALLSYTKTRTHLYNHWLPIVGRDMCNEAIARFIQDSSEYAKVTKLFKKDSLSYYQRGFGFQGKGAKYRQSKRRYKTQTEIFRSLQIDECTPIAFTVLNIAFIGRNPASREMPHYLEGLEIHALAARTPSEVLHAELEWDTIQVYANAVTVNTDFIESAKKKSLGMGRGNQPFAPQIQVQRKYSSRINHHSNNSNFDSTKLFELFFRPETTPAQTAAKTSNKKDSNSKRKDNKSIISPINPNIHNWKQRAKYTIPAFLLCCVATFYLLKLLRINVSSVLHTRNTNEEHNSQGSSQSGNYTFESAPTGTLVKSGREQNRDYPTQGKAADFVLLLPPPEKRYLTARTQARLTLMEEFALTVRITTQPDEPRGGQPISAPLFMSAGTLNVDIYAPDFLSIDGCTRTLDVPATGESNPVRFGLRAVQPGLRTIEINAWNGPVQVCSLTVSIAVEVPMPWGHTLGMTSSDMDLRVPEEGEYTLEVVYEPELSRYRFQLRCEEETFESVYSKPLLADRQQIISGILNKLNREARRLNRFSPIQARIFLRGLGTELYDQLIPASLQNALWQAHTKIKRFNILSKSDALPWEILFISDPVSGNGAFLTDTASVSRWHFGVRPPTQLQRSPAYFIVPPGAPPQAVDEVRNIAGMFNNARMVSDLDELLELTENGQFSLLHFAAHNIASQNTMEGFYIPFGDTRFDLTFLAGAQGVKYAANKTLIFMNACTTAGAAPLATELAGWADRFLKRGASAFVGSLWEVRDKSAANFADAFYSELTTGKTLGEAMKAGRDVIGRDDPTSLAYTLYGNPQAKMK
ncbi:CHAT domain-containing protein (plasmid) [Hymenobacter sp. 5317J-9]|uniref:CHAT domain-containing protein n=1 Tax=Hymenobacter sp. 5317J-9 TaxID=2932250 RepID=UPI001FD65975|nr:CHAT domain-containing protein [Hymenobacter sp. 5317J-9]UOR00222.1 CHAT domain-containing protein [Hymenobacter sp. 5317J-9]